MESFSKCKEASNLVWLLWVLKAWEIMQDDQYKNIPAGVRGLQPLQVWLEANHMFGKSHGPFSLFLLSDLYYW